jgi:divalent metal cation (Fe/Co/Zn/Cd) transporter
MARDPRITPEQQAEENSVQFGLVADSGVLVVLLLSGILGGSLTILAEAIRGSLMSLTEIFSLVVMRRIHRGQLADLEFGTGKLEQVANTVIGAAMLGGAVWIVIRALTVLVGERAVGAPFGLAMAAIAGALNAYLNFLAWDRMRRALRTESSLVMVGQLRARTVKLASSLFVLATMTLAALAMDEEVAAWADVIGSLFVAAFIVANALDMLAAGIADLLDRSAGRTVRDAIDRALARHAGDFGQVARVRSRRSGRVVFIEMALLFDPGLNIAEVNRRIDALKQSLGREIEHSEISVLALATPD